MSAIFARIADGNLRNSDGHYLLAWDNNEDGTGINNTTILEDLSVVNVSKQVARPQATREINIGANLTPVTHADTAFEVAQTIYDAKGNRHDIKLRFKKLPPEPHTVFFRSVTDGRILDKEFSVTMRNSWRVYAEFNDDTAFRSFNEEGDALTAISGQAVPIADVIFDETGKLSNIALPGTFQTYVKTAFPLNHVNPLGSERGARAGDRFNISNSTADFTDVAAVLRNSGVAGPFSSPPTEAEILDGIELLDSEEYPDAMVEIMQLFNRGGYSFEEDFARNILGYPAVDDGINELTRNAFFRFERPGVPADGDTSGINILASRLIDGGTGEIDFNTDDIGRDRFQTFADSANSVVEFVVDYDGRSGTDTDAIPIRLNLGSMNFKVLEAGGALNRSNVRIEAFGDAGSGRDGITQFYDDISTVRFADNNGKQASGLQSVDIDDDGTVLGIFNSGEQRRLRQVPLVVFTNPNGLAPATGRAYLPNAESGPALLRLANHTGAGDILNSALESSTIDIAQEFSDMIITQRSYSANAKLISTTQAMIDELSQRL